MFRAACKMIYPAICKVGGGSSHGKGKSHGEGCLIAHDTALTARHVYFTVAGKYEWPCLLKYDGLFQAEIIWENEPADLMLLRATRKIDEKGWSGPTVFPFLNVEPVSWGQTVGYFGSLHLIDEAGENNSSTFFHQASLSFMEHLQSEGLYYALSDGIIQKGFSGGPVFDPNGNILGVLVQSRQFTLNEEHPYPIVNTLPIASMILPFVDEIQSFL